MNRPVLQPAGLRSSRPRLRRASSHRPQIAASRRAADRPTRHTRNGFTLLEVLIATAVTLLMMVALAKIFKDIGTSMKQGRATLELNNRLRDVAHRIRRDLANATVVPRPPINEASGTGYGQYYDGPQTDYSTTHAYLTNPLNTDADPNNNTPNASRVGDVDDILMFTARAGDVWFSGKVPSFILERRIPSSADVFPAPSGNGLIDDFENMVSIGAQHAEVVLFCEPVVASTKTTFPQFNNPERNPGYLVAQPAFFKDSEGGAADGIPDAYRLYYRTLLVRPDLNTNGILPFNANTNPPLFTAGPESGSLPDGTPFTLPSPLCDMSRLHGLCDLSMRRVQDYDNSTRDPVAANSLEDLMDPANRFAHVQFPVSGTDFTMPLLALDSAAGGNGFLHPAFTLLGLRIGEDILASDILAFDVKGYDPSCVLLASYGVDRQPGVAGQDDDASGTADDAGEIGWAGSDDLILSPNDPGYATALAAGPVPSGSGEYVDLAWAHKIQAHVGLDFTAGMPVWTQLSGYSQDNYFPANAPAGRFPFTEALYKSGMIVQNGPLPINSNNNNVRGAPTIFQPSYDTWTSSYESDGLLQAELVGSSGIGRGTLLITNPINPSSQLRDSWRRLPAVVLDAATDGIDNNGQGGVDDISEHETSPPFPVQLRGLKISIRMEDAGTREVRQMSVAQEFVTQ